MYRLVNLQTGQTSYLKEGVQGDSWTAPQLLQLPDRVLHRLEPSHWVAVVEQYLLSTVWKFPEKCHHLCIGEDLEQVLPEERGGKVDAGTQAFFPHKVPPLGLSHLQTLCKKSVFTLN